ncbi:hypothetical protein VTN00DRAFT_7290 [Thermoascus crustaceus]|uniref:uncharacterized protein n=1 Tax=Thermoascus crustaceus TaxID=5088 RepID=UPI0037440185
MTCGGERTTSNSQRTFDTPSDDIDNPPFNGITSSLIQNDEGYLQLWQAPQQDAHPLQALWQTLPAHPEAHLCFLRLPIC